MNQWLKFGSMSVSPMLIAMLPASPTCSGKRGWSQAKLAQLVMIEAILSVSYDTWLIWLQSAA